MNKLFLYALLIVPAFCFGRQLPAAQHKKQVTTKSVRSRSISCTTEEIVFKNVHVIYRKRVISDNSHNDKAFCTGWNLGSKRISFIMTTAKPISSETLHGGFDFLPCEYSGTVSINGCVYDFVLNAGSWFSLSLDGKTSYFGCYGRKVRNYFVSPPEP